MKKNPIIVVLANATPLSTNKGCSALGLTSIYLINEVFSEFGIEYMLYLSDSGYHDGKEHSIVINGKSISFFDCAYPIGFSIIDNLKILLKKLFKRNPNDFVFRNADYILDIGSGDSFTDIYGVDWFNVIDRVHRTARFFSKPYCLLPQTIGPFSDEKVTEKAKMTLEKADRVMCRDIQSYTYVKELCPTVDNVKTYIDVAFFLPYSKWIFNNQKTHVGLNISALLWNGGYTKNNQFGLTVDYQKLIRKTIDLFVGNNDIVLHLVSHVLLEYNYIENDYEICYNLYKEYKCENIVLAPFFLDPIEAKSYIAGLSFFMGARMHATIAAISTGVPVIPMAYSRKFTGLFIDTLNYPYVIDMRCSNNFEAMQAIQSGYNERKHIREQIEVIQREIINEKKNELLMDLKSFFRFNNSKQQ